MNDIAPGLPPIDDDDLLAGEYVLGVLDADVFLSYIEAQPKDAASGLPLLQPLDPAFYSTRRFKGPN